MGLLKFPFTGSKFGTKIDNERLVPDNWVANCVQAIAVAIVHCHTSADRLTIYLTTIH